LIKVNKLIAGTPIVFRHRGELWNGLAEAPEHRRNQPRLMGGIGIRPGQGGKVSLQALYAVVSGRGDECAGQIGQMVTTCRPRG